MGETTEQTSLVPTVEEVAFYRREGYLKFGRIFSAEEFTDLQAAFESILAQAPPGIRSEHLDVPHFKHPELFRFLTHPKILDVIEAFIGPNITLWSSHFISKPKGDGLKVPWHTDADYWGNRIEPMEVITLWMAIDPSTKENGCMKVIPGSHLQKAEGLKYGAVDRAMNVFDTEIDAALIDGANVVDLELQPGECHFHDAFTIHASNPNHSEMRRCGYTMRYMPSHVVFRPNSPDDTHKVYLARGEDRTGGRTIYSEQPSG
ncbi:MAG: phytanoyl-CoA dioxygenase family protein [Candidatus Omnitrophica bacterium]|nr:phytanoyl-CoA dioxygenase family protein [Candidatus Omnitrophota bacterium]MCB9770713.1 phytanoyl-CoA dioxygenase family protein [Candidatus Omnitrophota bacterium]MCB9783259.1 phytanoyl-CoA dioxygenase family protein [Candidatus Omnitrophota bacterium]